MKLERITLKNFKCFSKLNFSYPKDNGLTLVTGINHQNASLGANGVGKTTLFDSICYGLYGKSANKLAAKSLMKIGAKNGYSVQLNFDNHTILRSWSPNLLTIDGRTVEQEEVEALIGLNFEQFLSAVYFNQKAEYFVDLSATEKLNLLSTVFDLDKWVDYAYNAKEKAAAANAILAPKLSKRSGSQQARDLLDESLIEVSKKHDQYIEEKQQKLAEFEKQKVEAAEKQADWKKQYNKERKELENKLAELEASVQAEINSPDLTADIAAINSLIKENTQKQEQLKGEIQNSRIQKGVIDGQIKAILSKTSSVENLTGDCPTCLQTIGEQHKESVKAENLKQLTHDQSVKKAIEDNEANLQQALGLLVHENDENTQLLNELKNKQLEASKVSAANEMNQKWKKDLEDKLAVPEPKNPFDSYFDSIDSQILLLNNQENPYENQTAELKQKCSDLLNEINSLTTEILTEQKQVASLEFWQSQFPKIRIAVLDEVTQELELHFNQALANLGLMDWHATIQSSKQLKDTRVKAELTITLFHNGVERSLESLSGGERQRIRIASAVGVSDLIKDRLGVDWALQMWDEPSLGLSEEGISSMLEFFEGLSQSQQIIIADHRILDRNCFGTILNIVKDHTGDSTISQNLSPALDLIGTT